MEKVQAGAKTGTAKKDHLTGRVVVNNKDKLFQFQIFLKEDFDPMAVNDERKTPRLDRV